MERSRRDTSCDARQILDDETRRTVGLIRYYKAQLSMETQRLQKAAESAAELRDEVRLLREHNAVLETRCAEAKTYLDFVGDKRRLFREAYYGIVDQEDFEIRDTNRMLRDLMVVSREITEILKMSHKAERAAVEQVAREEEEFRESIKEVLTERKELKKMIDAMQRSVDADEEKRKLVYDEVKCLERKMEAQQAQLALLDDRRENAETQLVIVREEIRRRCPRYVLPPLPRFMELPEELQEKKEPERAEAAKPSPKKSDRDSPSKNKKAETPAKEKSKGEVRKTPSKEKLCEKTSPVEQRTPKSDINVWKRTLTGKTRSAESLSEEEDLLSSHENESFFSVKGRRSSESSCYEDAVDLTQEDEEETKDSGDDDEEPEEPIQLISFAYPDPPSPPAVAMKATLVNLNLDLPNEPNSETDVAIASPPKDDQRTQSDGDSTQDEEEEESPHADLQLGGKFTLLRRASRK
uniref:Myosin_tail_1 domain-containing protein n=1 Tax=Steinernema glaseri TaxID=37863 RepID=A0A1I7YAM0_9BILA